jgi:hypothetical protein
MLIALHYVLLPIRNMALKFCGILLTAPRRTLLGIVRKTCPARALEPSNADRQVSTVAAPPAQGDAGCRF